MYAPANHFVTPWTFLIANMMPKTFTGPDRISGGRLGQGIYISYRHFWLNRLEKTLEGFRSHIVRQRLELPYHVSRI